MSVIGTNAIAIAITVVATGALVVGAQFIPPLTQPDAATFPEFQQYRPLDHDTPFIEARDAKGKRRLVDPGAYCRETLSGVDCACFAGKAHQVLANRNPRVSGWHYADDWELAVGQARDACT
ncbi:hypothetical protein [Sagittula stellata]|uniref:Uncharacterized protein n=1 Tax=Sagittula stellata (strain ATCC 700073 / DSM 11524 / E-37) TaxID=388399 RepID=A3JZU5_SAGS3|nr:hypothetical protein [Sagittula stellata]EBA09998.1 hypothetical protein SSE37_09318 [Sagittula stellata E-37]